MVFVRLSLPTVVGINPLPPPSPFMEAKKVSSCLSYVRSLIEQGEIQLSSSVFKMGYSIYEPASPFITYTNQVFVLSN
jgi:hypothetical protein